MTIDDTSHRVERYLAAFLPPARVAELVASLSIDGGDQPSDLFAAARRALHAAVTVSEDDEVVVLAEDAEVPLEDVAELVGLPEYVCREILVEEGIELEREMELVAPASPSPAEAAPVEGVAAADDVSNDVVSALAAVRSLTPEQLAQQEEAQALERIRAAEEAVLARSERPGTELRLSRVAVGVAIALGALLLLLMFVVVWRANQVEPASSCAGRIEVTSVHLTVGPPGAEGGAPRDTFTDSDDIQLWASFERAAEAPAELTVIWYRDGEALYSSPFALRAQDWLALRFSPLFAQPGSYRVELLDGTCVLGESTFSIG